jgi:gamma-glutamyl-gamma-aminobutyrate hydrolase PuuD
MSKRRRIVLPCLAAIVGLPVAAVVTYFVTRPAPPADGPRIGLVTASSFAITRPSYEDAIARAGGWSVLITPNEGHVDPDTLLDRVDALLLSGGDDVAPTLYGGDPSNAVSPDLRRDTFEIALIRAALARDMPVLGICRGIQILNVVHGGTIRNLRDEPASAARHGIDYDSLIAHTIEVVADSKLAAVIGTHTRQVNSFHSQSVDRVGAGLRVVATAEDGVIEAVERSDRDFVIGVQWHPEIQSWTDEEALTLFKALVRRAGRYASIDRAARE